MPTLTQKTIEQPDRTARQHDRRRWTLVAPRLATFMTSLDRTAIRVTWTEPGAVAAGNTAALLARWR